MVLCEPRDGDSKSNWELREGFLEKVSFEKWVSQELVVRWGWGLKVNRTVQVEEITC